METMAVTVETRKKRLSLKKCEHTSKTGVKHPKFWKCQIEK